MPDGTKVRAMDEAMIQETLDWYSRTVASCRKIGFDAILLHFGHGWLPDQFLSPFYNHRSDEYGGSIENRAGFPLRILEAVRDAVGPHYPVEMRISAYEWVEGSIEFPDVLAFSRMAERYVDMIQVSSGIDKNTVANVHCITTNLEPEMTNLGWARQVKRAVSIPVSVVGAFMTPQVAEDALARNDVDAVAFGRTLIADPDWPRKAMEGRPEDIVPCLRCNNCYHIASDHWNVGCSVNPHYHNESFVPKGIARADTGRNVVILGAGPGGMRAAITAFDRGHRVTLVEREDEPGGMLRFIARESHKSEVARLLGHYRAQLAKRDIRVMLGCEATPELVRALEPEALGIAIGATERRPAIEGIDGPKVLLATEAIMRADELEGRIVILGGGSIGCELALELAERGRQVLVGNRVDDVFRQLVELPELKERGIRESEAIDDPSAARIGLFDRFTRMMSDVYAPYIPVLATGGIASGIIGLLANMGVVAPDSLTYMTFYAIFYALIYFFPILLAFTAGKHFKCNPYVAATLGAAIMYPDVSDLLVTGASVNLLGINFTAFNFGGSFIPILLAVFCMSLFERWLKRVAPSSVQFVIVPALCLFVFVPLTIMVFGPLGGLAANGISALYTVLANNLIVMDVVLGALFSIIILLGLHWAVTPIMLAVLASQGFEYGLAAGGMGNYAALGICLAVMLFAKDPQDKTAAGSAAFTNALCGITEPGLYGVILRDKRLIATMVVSGACGGLVLGLGQVAATNFAFSGILSFGAWLGAKNFPMYCLGIAISLVASFASTAILLKSGGIRDFG